MATYRKPQSAYNQHAGIGATTTTGRPRAQIDIR